MASMALPLDQLYFSALLTVLCFPFSIQGKLDDYQAKKNKGDRLNQDQLVSSM